MLFSYGSKGTRFYIIIKGLVGIFAPLIKNKEEKNDFLNKNQEVLAMNSNNLQRKSMKKRESLINSGNLQRKLDIYL